MRQKIAIGIILVITFIVCIAIGIYIYKIEELSNTNIDIETIQKVSNQKITDECTKEAQELALTNSIEKKVSPNATFIMKTEHLKCGHTTKKYETAPPFTINLSKNDLQNMYEDWEIESFSNNEVVMKKIVDDTCGEHFLVREKEGEIAVFNLEENSDNEVLIHETGIVVNYLPEVDKSNLKKGIIVNGKEELNKLLENFE